MLAQGASAQADTSHDVGSVESAIEVLFYDVEGDDAGSITASLEQRSPSIGARRFYGATEWEVNAEYRWIERPTGCTLEGVRVRLLIQTRLPRWAPRGPTDAGLRRAWERFARDLDAHETHHRDLIAAAADDMRWRLVSLRQPGCSTMALAAQRTLAEAIEETKTRNEAFDVRTQHGKTQGAVWPPEAWDVP